MKRIPNYNTFADVCDRLIVEILKLSFYENRKREESLKDKPNEILIVLMDRNSRDACEYRDLLKGEIDRILSEIVSNKSYETLPRSRTFASPSKSVGELIAEMTYTVSKELKEQLAESLEEKLNGRG